MPSGEIQLPSQLPSMADLAEAAGVSLATVDRVLNRRKGVKARTVERVLKAAVDLGYMGAEEREIASRMWRQECSP